MCGSSQPPKAEDKSPHNELVVQLTNLQAQQAASAEKHADNLQIIIYLIIAAIVIIGVYILYKHIVRLERIRTEQVVRNTISLASLKDNV